jgi:hypothetical protein
LVVIIMIKVSKASSKTPFHALQALPQLRQPEGFDIVDFETLSGFEPERRGEIRKVLTKYIEPYLRRDEPTALEQFLRETEHAIAIYKYQYNVQPTDNMQLSFDRRKAKTYLSKAATAVSTAQKSLQAIAGWPELSRFLERLFLAHRNGTQNQRVRHEKTVLQQIKLIEKSSKEREAFRSIQPEHLSDDLFNLKLLLILAAKRVTFQPGEVQRNDAAREFVDAMASAWFAAAGRRPTYSKPSPHSRRPSPFAELLTAINEKILDGKTRSANYFREYALQSVKRTKAKLKKKQ